MLPFTLSSCATEPTLIPDWVDIPLSENTYSDNSLPYNEGSYSIPVAAYSALEFKLGLTEGNSIVYHWEVDMAEPNLLSVEFHGHTEREEGQPGTVMFYKIHSNDEGSGTLIAPFTGIHGWYLNNQSDEDIVITLGVAGFYTGPV